MIGSTISHYKILDKLGEGGMGIVYKAQDLTLDRLVALKFLPTDASSGSDSSRFLQEARAAAALNHPNICTIYGIEEADARSFIVMEFVDGQTLQERKSSLSVKQAIDIGIQIAEGLAVAHEKGIVHRDIKPENIMIRRDGIVQVMDFGLAKLRGTTRLTKEGSTVGTAGYMSPEQVQGQETDHRSDIFSLGVLLYEMLTGQLPFKGIHETAVSYEIVNVDSPPPSSLKPEIPNDVDAIVLECLQKDKADRYQSAAEVAKELRRYKRESSRSRASRVTAAQPNLRPSSIQTPGAESLADQKMHIAGRSYFPAFMTKERLVWGAILVVLLMTTFLHLLEKPAELRVTRSSILAPDGTVFAAGLGGHIALSPNGRVFAFVARDTTGKRLLWVRPLGSTVGQPLSGTDGASFPFWSPDSRVIGYFAEGRMKKVDATGGPSQTICDSESGRGGTWSEGGTIVFCPAGGRYPLYRVSAAGGIPVALTELDTLLNEQSHRWPHFLPDGKHFIYVTRTTAGGTTEADGIFLASLDSTEKPRLLLRASSSAEYANGQLIFARERTLMAQPFDPDALALKGDAVPIAEEVYFEGFTSKTSFTVSTEGMLAYQTGTGIVGVQMEWVDRTGAQLQAFATGTLSYDLRVSPDGRRVAVSQYEGKSRNLDVWLYETGRALWTRFTFDQAIDRFPIWSPDGATVVFSSFRMGPANLYRRPSDGSGVDELLLQTHRDKVASDWSRDGRFIAYQEDNPTTRADLWILPLEGDRKPFAFLQTEYLEARPAFSPDGRWIAYQSNESGRNEIYIRPYPGPGGKWQVSTSGGAFVRWRGDGKELFYLDGGRVMAVDVKLGKTSVEVGTPQNLFQFRPFAGAGRELYGVTNDGQRFLLITVSGEERSSPVTLVMNWHTELQSQ